MPQHSSSYTMTKVLTTAPLMLLAVLFAVLLLISAAKAQEERDRQLLMAFNAGFHELVASGEYDRILTKWGLDPASAGYNPCSPDSAQNQWPTTPVGSLQTILEKSKTISFGRAAFVHEPFWNGNSGLEDDIAKGVTAAIRKHYGVQDLVMRWVNPLIDASGFFESLYKDLESYGSDIVLSAVSVTAKREELVDFTCSYLTLPDTILRSGLDPERNLTTLQQLNASGVKVAVMLGTIYEDIAQNNLPSATITTVDAFADGFDLATSNQVHAFLGDGFLIRSLLDTDPCNNCSTHNFGPGSPIAAFLRKPEESLSSLASTITTMYSAAIFAAALLFAMLFI